MKTKLLIVAAVLAGCATPPEKIAANVAAQCRAYGFKPGTDAYANCLMTTEQATLARIPRGCTLVGDGDVMFCPPGR